MMAPRYSNDAPRSVDALADARAAGVQDGQQDLIRQLSRRTLDEFNTKQGQALARTASQAALLVLAEDDQFIARIVAAANRPGPVWVMLRWLACLALWGFMGLSPVPKAVVSLFFALGCTSAIWVNILLVALHTAIMWSIEDFRDRPLRKRVRMTGWLILTALLYNVEPPATNVATASGFLDQQLDLDAAFARRGVSPFGLLLAQDAFPGLLHDHARGYEDLHHWTARCGLRVCNVSDRECRRVVKWAANVSQHPPELPPDLCANDTARRAHCQWCNDTRARVARANDPLGSVADTLGRQRRAVAGILVDWASKHTPHGTTVALPGNRSVSREDLVGNWRGRAATVNLTEAVLYHHAVRLSVAETVHAEVRIAALQQFWILSKSFVSDVMGWVAFGFRCVEMEYVDHSIMGAKALLDAFRVKAWLSERLGGAPLDAKRVPLALVAPDMDPTLVVRADRSLAERYYTAAQFRALFVDAGNCSAPGGGNGTEGQGEYRGHYDTPLTQDAPVSVWVGFITAIGGAYVAGVNGRRRR